MIVEHLEVMVEEPSMEAALRQLLPRIVGDTPFSIYTHQCKADLLLRLPARMKGYANWLPPGYRIMVLVDRDDEDCRTLKKRLEHIASRSKLRTRTQAAGSTWQVVNRVVIEELESWYFGDWKAVRAAYPKVPETVPSQAKYRDPDAIQGAWEAFERVLQQAGYFKGGLRKIEAARSISRHMDPDRNSSRSFQALLHALKEMVEMPSERR